MGPNVGDEQQWVFPSVELTELERKLLVGEVLKIGVQTMFETHLYSFGGRVYRQRVGGPIGLRSTCALARVIMALWDIKWGERLEE